jgi:hypothetical protein
MMKTSFRNLSRSGLVVAEDWWLCVAERGNFPLNYHVLASDGTLIEDPVRHLGGLEGVLVTGRRMRGCVCVCVCVCMCALASEAFW